MVADSKRWVARLSNQKRSRRKSRSPVRASAAFWVLAGLLASVFLTGGGARADLQSLVVLRPLAIIAGMWGLWTLRREHLRGQGWVFGIALAAIALALSHLIPLPPALWTSLAGRELVTTIDTVTGLGEIWRPIALVPAGALNAFYASLVVAAVLVLAVQIDVFEHWRLICLIVALGALSALLGVLQIIGDPDSALYLYRVTNRGSVVGLFANRNHAAIMLATLFPVLAVFASWRSEHLERVRLRTAVALAGGLFLIPLILVTGSRAGLVAAVIGLASVPLLYRRPAVAGPDGNLGWRNPLWIAAWSGAVVLGAITIWLARAEAFDRLFATGGWDQERLDIWGPVRVIGDNYVPFGSGIGSFEQVYQVWEPLAQMRTTYANHAHNDYLEAYMTGGWPALILIAICFVAWGLGTWLAWRTPDGGRRDDIDLARLGSVVLAIMAAGSVTDYPLRVPSLACFAALAAVWLAMPMKMAGRGRAAQ